jgi:hypothetical protein
MLSFDLTDSPMKKKGSFDIYYSQRVLEHSQDFVEKSVDWILGP